VPGRGQTAFADGRCELSTANFGTAGVDSIKAYQVACFEDDAESSFYFLEVGLR